MPTHRLPALALALSLTGLAGCIGDDHTAPPAGCAARAASAKDLAVTILLVPSGPEAVRAVDSLAGDRDFRGVGIVAAYGGPAPYQELARAAIDSTGAPNQKYAAAQLAAARRCLLDTTTTAATKLPADGHGDALTAVAIGLETARPITGDAHAARVVVYGAGGLVTSGLDLAAADLSTPERQDGIVSALQSSGLLEFRGGPRSEIVFAGLSEGAANAVVARQRESLFQRVCAAAEVGACSTSMGASK